MPKSNPCKAKAAPLKIGGVSPRIDADAAVDGLFLIRELPNHGAVTTNLSCFKQLYIFSVTTFFDNGVDNLLLEFCWRFNLRRSRGDNAACGRRECVGAIYLVPLLFARILRFEHLAKILRFGSKEYGAVDREAQGVLLERKMAFFGFPTSPCKNTKPSRPLPSMT